MLAPLEDNNESMFHPGQETMSSHQALGKFSKQIKN